MNAMAIQPECVIRRILGHRRRRQPTDPPVHSANPAARSRGGGGTGPAQAMSTRLPAQDRPRSTTASRFDMRCRPS